MNKRGQDSGGGAAALVALIALFMVLYVLFLPPEERSKILGDGTATADEEKIDSLTKDLLLTNPGRVMPKGDMIALHLMPSVLLTTKIESVKLDAWDSFTVKKSYLSSVQQDLKFSVKDLENTDNVLLNFIMVKGQGILNIFLNGEQIYSNEITTKNIEPIKIRKQILKNDNILAFSVSSPGAAFWSSNSYTLSGITLHADIADKSKQLVQTAFYINPEEKNLLKRTMLGFTTLCGTDIGKLVLALNGKILFEGSPACNLPTRMEVPLDFIVSGANTMMWKADQGSYKFDVVQLENALKEPQNYRVYFSVTKEQYNYAAENNYPFLLSMIFAGQEERKARLFVNELLINLDTSAQDIKLDISEYVRKGYNSIEIEPSVPFDVQELKVNIGSTE